MPFVDKSIAADTDGDSDIARDLQSTPNAMAAAQASSNVGTTPTLEQEVQFLNGLNPDGTIATSNSAFVNVNGESSAFKWGASTAGTGATVSYAFDPTSNFTAEEKVTVREAFANWAAVANITFVENQNPEQSGTANIFLNRNTDSTAFADPGETTASGATLGQPERPVFVTVDIVAFGVDAPSAWRHEIGHAIGLGHGGDYNGDDSTPPNSQFSAFDDHQYTTMSYVSWPDSNARFADQNPNPGTNWGNTPQGNPRTFSDTIQMLDILAVQQLYGVSNSTPFSGGQTYGFNSNITGLLNNTYDFSISSLPVVTLYNKGLGNTLDLSGFVVDQRVDLNSGKFSDVGGLQNNLAIAIGTIINDVIGGSGIDIVLGNRFANVIFGMNGNDSLNGGGGTDTLRGDAGNDGLDGGTGNDTMMGGAGNDIYIVDAAGDRVLETTTTTSTIDAGGIDTVQSAVDFSLDASAGVRFVERLTLTGRGDLDGTGNALSNILTGNAGANVLSGGLGNDTMLGGAGDDTYVVDARFDRVFETTTTNGTVDTGGIDTVRSSVSFSLDTLPGSRFVENLVLTGTADVNGIGNALANRLSGNAGDNALTGGLGADVLLGGVGNDTLIGGLGTDTLVGGAGNDSFVFNTTPGTGNVDRISDFSVADDTIRLDDAIFTGLARGVLTSTAFAANTTGLAADATDRIIYETDLGRLFFDIDGVGGVARVQIATLTAGLALTNTDFILF